MQSSSTRQLTVELIWWAFTLTLTALVLLPIYSFGINFPFYVYNGVFVVAAITVTRILFFLDISWLRSRFLAQGALIFLMIPLVFFMGQGLNEFVTYLDNNGPDYFIHHLERDEGRAINTYLRSEYFFFGVWAIIAGVILPFRVIYFVWHRYRKRKA